MNITRETKKEEALRRMHALGLFAPCINAFKRKNEVQLSERNGGLYEFGTDIELTTTIREIEQQYNLLVYHVIHSPINIEGGYMDLYHLLYVSDHEADWEYDKADMADGYVMTYTWNKTVEYFSEFGSIAVEGKFGGLVAL